MRMTLTAIALGAMTLSACSTTETVTAPVAPAPVVTAPSATTTTASDITRRPGFSGNGGTAIPGTPANAAVNVDVTPPAADITRRPGFDDVVVGTDSLLNQPADPAGVTSNPVFDPANPVEKAADITRRPGFEEPGNVGTDKIPGDAMMAKDAMMAPGDANSAAFDACFAGGGQVVNFIGDPTGDTMACENDGVQTIIVL